MIKKTLLVLLTSFSFVISATAATVYTAGAVSTATGGSGRGVIEPVDSILLNPAIVSQMNSKFFSVNYSKDQWGITIADNGREALFPAALAFVRNESALLSTQQLALILAHNFGHFFSVGLNVSLVEYDQLITGQSKKFQQTIGQVAIAYMPTQNFGFGIVTNRAFSSETELAPPLQVQKTFGAGLNYTYLSFIRFRFDIESAPENKTNKLVYMGGIETYMNDWIIIRLGYQNNNVVQKNYVTGGLGFAGPQFGLHYGYMQNVAERSEDKHSIDLAIPF
ncbi:MAG: hypothetical protein H7061_05280 [Bdellovibrionaceae bacterium]|nr:hypothetical protein [Bdellovibrio sp.]